MLHLIINIQENNRGHKNNSAPGNNIRIHEKGKNVEQASIPQPSQKSKPFVSCYSMPNMPQVGSYGTLFSTNENEISTANVHGENIPTNGAVSMINFPSYPHLLSDFGNATSYLGDNFFDVTNDGIAQQFIGLQPNGNPSQRDFANQQVYYCGNWTTGTSNSRGGGLFVEQCTLKPFFFDTLDEKDIQVFIDGRRRCKVHFTIYCSLQ